MVFSESDSLSLHIVLLEEINRIMPDAPLLASEVRARARLDELANSAPAILELLAGDYLSGDDSWETLSNCALIHLYARILDDVLDENMAVHRRNLLCAQSMFWRATGNLAMRHGGFWHEATQLINETVDGVSEDDCRIAIRAWGLKNHHLLLIPLLLTENSSLYQSSRTALSRSIWLLQAREELHQGRVWSVTTSFLDDFSRFMSGPELPLLAQNGWSLLVDRCFHEGRKVLELLQQNPGNC